MGPAVGYLIEAVFVVIGLGIAWRGWQRYRRDAARHTAASAWPEAQGVIVESRIDLQSSNPDAQSAFYRPVVRYRFVVDGRTIEGNSVTLCPRDDLDEDDARAWANAHSADAPIAVRYDPVNPGDNTLLVNKANLLGASMTIAVGLVLVGIAVALLVSI